MTAKTILALAQAHRKEPSRANYDTMASAVRALVDERDQLREFSKLAGRAMNDAHAVVDTVDGKDSMECEKLMELLNALRELTYQAYTLNGVMSAGQLKATEGKS